MKMKIAPLAGAAKDVGLSAAEQKTSLSLTKERTSGLGLGGLKKAVLF
jgi:hypothetical protein